MSSSLAALVLVSLAACDVSRAAAGEGSPLTRALSTPAPWTPVTARTGSSPGRPYASPADTTPSDSSSTVASEEGSDSDAGDADSSASDTTAVPPARPDSVLSSEAVAAMKAALGIRAAERATADTLPRTVEALREAGPVYVPYDASPTLVRDRELRRLLEENLVPVIEEKALSVRTGTRFWVLVDTEGEVADAVIQTPSGDSAFDRAATQVAVSLRYEPAVYRGQPTPVWVLVRVSLLMP